MQNIITVDGPSGVGKGTLSLELAKKLQWHFLDSGAIYRAVAVYALKKEIDLEDEMQVAALAKTLPLTFKVTSNQLAIYLADEEVTKLIRAETTGNAASIVAKHPLVRENLLQRQRDFAQMPGLIADGRDMGTVVFPKAPLKLFLTASAKVRAERRYKQLLDSGICVNIEQILSEVEARDERDRSRSASPLIPAEDALIIDTSELGVEDVLQKAWEAVIKTFPKR
ncbi:(d)CMP kinase [Ignatzschineria rhizosphaerae]|uniref:Cytidylate kinase n=1 Tax=Ignatzschineria rhizosphaerae TaxID=2923279 RepID=A0ABY3X3T5_9GAMM|nr:(d)CMP kinase [Ignatzschineria rhizosphaerae]UNM95430.1 (d)CMP kinase [Ignatzschineria rhizosphaerae]